MNNDKDDLSNSPSEEEIELKRYIKKGNHLKWAWLIGLPVLIICILYGDASQWVLAVFIAVYIYLSTVNYFK